jgi:phosphoribosylaminoimidazole-succinocarboxamide synthase
MLTDEQIRQAIPNVLCTADLEGFGPKHQGKVRDMYRAGDKRILITTDRISAFDRVLGLIPFKGQVLNELSAWWFEQTRHIVPNHLIEVPDPNVMIGREAVPLPVEVVVRGYLTGVTNTALWTLYSQGERNPYGIVLPDGLQKNDPLPIPIITPTTKATGGAHDELLTRGQIIQRGLVNPPLWEQVEAKALALFGYGQWVAQQAGLILVDTKYEFGLIDGKLALIDEIHTPDSSRYWTKASYGSGRQPEHFDKEYMRFWFNRQGYRGDGEPPIMPDDFVVEMAQRYIAAYEKLTGRDFVPDEYPAPARITRNLEKYRAN